MDIQSKRYDLLVLLNHVDGAETGQRLVTVSYCSMQEPTVERVKEFHFGDLWTVQAFQVKEVEVVELDVEPYYRIPVYWDEED